MNNKIDERDDELLAMASRLSTEVTPERDLWPDIQAAITTPRRSRWTPMFAQAAADDTGRVRQLYETAYGRLPTSDESVRALAFVIQYEQSLADEKDPQARTTQAWQALCHVIVASNEFVYVR